MKSAALFTLHCHLDNKVAGGDDVAELAYLLGHHGAVKEVFCLFIDYVKTV